MLHNLLPNWSAKKVQNKTNLQGSRVEAVPAVLRRHAAGPRASRPHRLATEALTVCDLTIRPLPAPPLGPPELGLRPSPAQPARVRLLAAQAGSQIRLGAAARLPRQPTEQLRRPPPPLPLLLPSQAAAGSLPRWILSTVR